MILDGELTLSSNFAGEMSMANQLDGQLNVVLAPSADKHYAYEQAQPSDTWEIQHNLRKYPSVSITDTANTEVVGEVQYLDENSLRVTFSAPVAGYAYMN